MRIFLQRSALAVCVCAALLAAPAHAITVVEANAGPQFNFVNPGARSLGMGGAFIGLADDSTAAYTNPAGLAQLTRKEFAAEARHTGYSTESVRGGRYYGAPTGIGIDTVAGLDTQETESDVTNLSFLSFAFPVHNGTLAVYRHELANFEAGFTNDGQFVETLGQTPGEPPRTSRWLPSINDIDLEIVNYAVAGSWRLGDKVMLGGSLNYYRFDIDTNTRRFSLDADGDGAISPLERLSVLDFSPSAELAQLRQQGSDSDIGFNVGLLLTPNDKWSVGAVYRRGPDFEYDFLSYNQGVLAYSGQTDFTVPDVFGIGIGYRPSDAWRISLDAAHVTYSDHAGEVLEQSSPGEVDYLTLDDGTEVRLGAEYTNVEAKTPFSIRFGAWHEPAHRLYWDGEFVPFSGTPQTFEVAAENGRAGMFLRGKDSWHGTAGVGFVFPKFQLDAAVDLSDQVDVFSLSMVFFLD